LRERAECGSAMATIAIAVAARLSAKRIHQDLICARGVTGGPRVG
jgi:hypothetical protein